MKYLFTVFTTLLISFTAQAQDIKLADSFYNAGQYKMSFELYNKAAKAGNDTAMAMLGKHYLLGNYVDTNHQEALVWLRKAEALGNSIGINTLGTMYFYGNGFNVDRDKAFDYYLISGNKGYVNAMYNLGYSYMLDKNHQDYALSLEWFTKAFEHHDTDAAIFIGTIYDDGLGVQQDCQQAIKWFEIVAKSNDYYGYINLANIYYDDDRCPADYAKAFKNAYKAMQLDEQSKTAHSILAEMYYKGKGIARNFDSSYYHVLKAKSNDDMFRTISHMLLLYTDVVKQKEEQDTDALQWFEEKAANGDTILTCMLGTLYFFEYISANQNDESLDNLMKWLTLSAKYNYMEGIELLAATYLVKTSKYYSKKKAVHYYKMAARLGSKNARDYLNSNNINWQ